MLLERIPIGSNRTALSLLAFTHVLIGKPASTFPGHALNRANREFAGNPSPRTRGDGVAPAWRAEDRLRCLAAVGSAAADGTELIQWRSALEMLDEDAADAARAGRRGDR